MPQPIARRITQNAKPITHNKWKMMLAVAMGVLLATIDAGIVNVAFPTLVRQLNTVFPVLQWVVLGYLLTLATLTLLVGRLGDVLGKKRIFTTGFAVFTVASLLCGLSPSIGWLIGFRVLQALGAVMILALGPAILTDAFPARERGRALGLIGTVVSVGIVSGPFLGGLLIQGGSWRWIFLVNLPVGVIGVFTALRFVPNTPPSGRRRFDLPGALLLFGALLTFSLALTLGQSFGFGSPLILFLLAVAVGCGAAFIRVERKAEAPMVNLGLFENHTLSIAVATGFFSFVAIGGYFTVLPFYLENVMGLDPASSGRLLAVSPLVLGVVAPIAGLLSDRIGIRPITITGLLVLAAAYFGSQRLSIETSVVGFVAFTVPVGLGMGIFQSPNNSAIMGSVAREHSGVAGGLLTLTRILGQLTGLALLGSLWATRVVSHAGSGPAAEAPPSALVAGTREIFLIIGIMLSLALLLAIWGLERDRRAAAVRG